MLCIAVHAADRTGIGVDLVVILRVGRTRAADELDLILQAAVVAAELTLDEHHVVRGEARVRQRNFTRTAHGNGRFRRCSGSAAGGVIGVVIGHFTGQEYRAVGRVPFDVHTHQLTDRADRQVDRSLIQQRINYFAIHIAEGARHAVDHDGVVRPHLHGDGLLDRRVIRRALGCGRRSHAADGRSLAGCIPVYILAHQLADRTDRHIGGAAVADRMHLIALCVVERLHDAADTDRDVRAEFG